MLASSVGTSGVIAPQDLHPGLVSRLIPVNTLQRPTSNHSKIVIKVSEDGKWLMSDDDLSFLKSLTISEDCHSCNTMLCRGSKDGTLQLNILKPIRTGEPLKLWFSDELLASLEIPFLSPLNIQGEKCYVCHRCRTCFEFPNPLKLHLAFDCDTQPMGDLWSKLSGSFYSPNNNTRFNFSLRGSIDNSNPPSPSLTTYSNPSPKHCEPISDDESRPSSEPPFHSAFRPYLSTLGMPLHTVKPNIYLQESSIEQEMLLSRQAAEIETIVSNMGQSKQGHLCLYCGKFYSRKYGLKIHIRTHTGFKPLKCKYCLRPFGDPSNLNKHVRLHTEGETPYKCDLCGKVLVRRRDLERHLKTRHQEIF